jgi:hypothetical protein
MKPKTQFALLAAAVISAATLNAHTFTETFNTPPESNGWSLFGNASLFQWNSENQNLEVTWDSSQPNSFFHRPLGTILSRHDDFSLAFELRLDEISFGTTPDKPYAFQIAVGFLNHSTATGKGFFRSSGMDSPNLVEFNYFPDAGFGATISPTFISAEHQFASGFNFPLELVPNALFRIEMNYSATTSTLTITMTKDGQAFGPIDDVVLGASFDDFRVDHFAVSSYSDGGQHPDWGGSVLAKGVIDNIILTLPPPPVWRIGIALDEGTWRVQFHGRANWRYVLERSDDLQTWTAAAETVSEEDDLLRLEDSGAGESAFYRIRAEKP